MTLPVFSKSSLVKCKQKDTIILIKLKQIFLFLKTTRKYLILCLLVLLQQPKLANQIKKTLNKLLYYKFVFIFFFKLLILKPFTRILFTKQRLLRLKWCFERYKNKTAKKRRKFLFLKKRIYKGYFASQKYLYFNKVSIIPERSHGFPTKLKKTRRI